MSQPLTPLLSLEHAERATNLPPSLPPSHLMNIGMSSGRMDPMYSMGTGRLTPTRSLSPHLPSRLNDSDDEDNEDETTDKLPSGFIVLHTDIVDADPDELT